MNLVQIFFCFVIFALHNKRPPTLKGLVSTAKAGKLWLDALPELKALITSYNSASTKQGDFASQLSEFARPLKKFATTEYLRHEGAKQTFKDVLVDFASWFATQSESSYKKLAKLSARSDNQGIPAFFTQTKINQADVETTLLKLVKQLGGKKGSSALTVDEAKSAKAKNPELYKEYMKLRRSFGESWQNALSNYVRASGKKVVPYQEALKFLASEGYKHGLPTGFTGAIDANGNWYTSDEKPIEGKPASALFPSVVMNPDYGKGPGQKDWVFVAVRSDGTKGNYFYTKDYKVSRKQDKFSKVQNLIPIMDKVRKKWLTRINSFDEYDKLSVVSVVLELLYRSSNRIGTVGGNKKTGAGFGMGTILCKMVEKTPQGYRIQYQGKDNIKTIYILKRNADQFAKKAAAALDQLLADKKPTDPVFTFKLKTGVRKPVLPTSVRDYFKSISGGLSVHKIRTYWGTKLFMEGRDAVYAKRKTIDTPKEALEVLNKLALTVGARLNHVRSSVEGEMKVTPKTALDNYIDPGVQMEFFEHYGLPLPKYLEKLLSTTANTDVPDSDDVDSEYDKHALDSDLDTRLLERHLIGDRTAVFNPLVD